MILTASLDKITAIMVDNGIWIAIKSKTAKFEVMADPDSKKKAGLLFQDAGGAENLLTWISLDSIAGYKIG